MNTKWKYHQPPVLHGRAYNGVNDDSKSEGLLTDASMIEIGMDKCAKGMFKRGRLLETETIAFIVGVAIKDMEQVLYMISVKYEISLTVFFISTD